MLILEDEASLARRVMAGTPVAAHVGYDGCSTDLMLSMDLPTGKEITVEIERRQRHADP
jgi:hypothetical protein